MNMNIHQKTHPRIFTSALFITAHILNNLNVYYTTMDKFWYLHTTDAYTEIRINYYMQQCGYTSQSEPKKSDTTECMILFIISTKSGKTTRPC